MMEQAQVVAALKPNIAGEFGCDNFDSQFTNEPLWLTPDDDDTGKSEFEGFDCIDSLLMSAVQSV